MKTHRTRLRAPRRGTALLIASCTLATTGAVVGTAGSASALPPAAFAPVPPQNLHVTANGYLTWDDAPGVSAYYVWRDGNFLESESGGSTTYSYSDSATAGDGKAHTYTVSEYYPAAPAEARSSTVAEPPVNLKQMDGQLLWDAVGGHNLNGNDGYGYMMYLNGQYSGAVTGWPIITLPNDLIPGAQYSATIASAAVANNVYTPNGNPSKALSFTYEPQVDGLSWAPIYEGIQLSWNKVANQGQSNPVRYAIYRDGKYIGQAMGGTYTDTESSDPGLTPQVSHCYTVQAYYDGSTQAYGEGSQSQVVCGQF